MIFFPKLSGNFLRYREARNEQRVWYANNEKRVNKTKNNFFSKDNVISVLILAEIVIILSISCFLHYHIVILIKS